MKWPAIRFKILLPAAALGVVLSGGLYLLRWPLFGGWVRGLVERKLAQASGAPVHAEALGGTLLSGLRIRGIRIDRAPGSPLEAASLDRLEVSYPWFGLGGLRVRARGLTVQLAASKSSGPRPSGGPAPPLQDRIRETLAAVERFRAPATVQVEEATLVTPSGETVGIPEVHLERRSAGGTLRSAGTGDVRWSVSIGPNHRIDAEAHAERGPISEVALRLGAEHGFHPLEIRCRALSREVRFMGQADFGSDGLLVRVGGRFDADGGRATVELDLRSGELRAESEAEIRLESELRGRLTLRGLLEGRLSQSPEYWTLSGLEVRGAGVYREWPVSLDLSSSGGTLGSLPWKGALRQGGDEITANGHVGLAGGFGLVVALRATIRDLSAYGKLLPEGMVAQAKALTFDGQVHVDRQGPWIEGTVAAGPGRISGVSWSELRLSARGTPSELSICEFYGSGLPGLRRGSIGGEFRLLGPAGSAGWAAVLDGRAPLEASFKVRSTRAIEPDLPVGVLTDLEVEGHFGKRGLEEVELRGTLGEGRFRALGRWEFLVAGGAVSVHLVGDEMLVYSARAARLRLTPNVWVDRKGLGWAVQGQIDVPAAIVYDEFSGGSPGTGRATAVAAPKVRLPAAPSGGVLVPLGIAAPWPVELDLAITTSRPLRIENALVGTLLSADLHVGGTLAEPALSGTVESRQGEVKLATGIVLRIERLKVELPRGSGDIPSVYFRGHTGKGEGAITATVAGPLEGPSLTLSSNPPKKQEELIAALAFGRSAGDVGGEQALGMVAGKALAQATDERPRAEPVEGFWQRLDLGVTSEDAPDPTKRLPWELPPTASARGTIVRTEYILSPLFSVVVETDREANVSGDFKVRFHFR